MSIELSIKNSVICARNEASGTGVAARGESFGVLARALGCVHRRGLAHRDDTKHHQLGDHSKHNHLLQGNKAGGRIEKSEQRGTRLGVCGSPRSGRPPRGSATMSEADPR